MTVREKFEIELCGYNLSKEQAEEIMDAYVKSPGSGIVKGRMDEDTEDYPASVLISVWIGVRQIALEWINNNCPGHSARAMLV